MDSIGDQPMRIPTAPDSGVVLTAYKSTSRESPAKLMSVTVESPILQDLSPSEPACQGGRLETLVSAQNTLKLAPIRTPTRPRPLIDEQRIPAAEERLRKAIKAFPPDAKKDTAPHPPPPRRPLGIPGKNADAAHALRQRADAMDPK